MSNIIDRSKSFVREYFEKNVSSKYTYHNFDHTINVVNASKQLANEANLSDEESEVLILAALFHDVGFGSDPNNHEQKSKEIAIEFLQANDYDTDKTEMVANCIMATRKEWKGQNKLCRLMKDADLSGLASPNYTNITENLRIELNKANGMDIDKVQWLNENISFIQNHSYFTEEGRKLFNEGKQNNLQTLHGLEQEKKKKKKKKKNKLLTIGSSKSAQTQFKTALRNHIDLSAIADNKANIMLSVNAIVITVGVPILVNLSYENSDLIIPTAILAIGSLLSMIFATLSTRPAKMPGHTSLGHIAEKKSNLFFFGNFYKMSFDEYVKGMEKVVGNNEILDNSITRDLFFLGKSLGHKFEYLRWCYNIFMYGIAIAMLSFLIVILI